MIRGVEKMYFFTLKVSKKEKHIRVWEDFGFQVDFGFYVGFLHF
jgi:hypothetical protein